MKLRGLAALLSAACTTSGAGPDPECAGTCPIGTRKAQFSISEITEHPGAVLIRTATCDLACAPEMLCVPPNIPTVRADPTTKVATFTCEILGGVSGIPKDSDVDLSFGAEFMSGPRGPVATIDVPHDFAAIELGDLDGDALEDVVVYQPNPLTLSAYVVTSSGARKTFEQTFPDIGTSRAFTLRGAVAVTDVDGDAKRDLVVPTGRANDQSCMVLFFKGDGAGDFDVTERPLIPVCADSIFAYDADGDGDEDLFIGTAEPPETISVHWSNGDASFRAQMISSNFFSRIDFADFDGDGKLDLLSASPYTVAPFAIWLAPYTGQLTPTFSNNYAYYSPAGDYDGDGKADLLVPGIAANTSGSVVLRGNGDGTFRDAAPEPADADGLCQEPHGYAFDDDGDGRDDLTCLVRSFTPSTTSVVATFRARAGGGFSGPIRRQVEVPTLELLSMPLDVAKAKRMGFASLTHKKVFVLEVP